MFDRLIRGVWCKGHLVTPTELVTPFRACRTHDGSAIFCRGVKVFSQGLEFGS